MISLFFTLTSAILGLAMFGTILFSSERPESENVADGRDLGSAGSPAPAATMLTAGVRSVAELSQVLAVKRQTAASGAQRTAAVHSSLQMAAQTSSAAPSRMQMSGRA